MGAGTWSDDLYRMEKLTRKKSGTADFDYSAKVASGKATGVSASLDPTKMVNGIREARDSDEHPESLPIVVFFDVTGSMRDVPRKMQTELIKLMDIVKNKASIPHPQVLVGAIGDSHCDHYPFQVGQFESDNKFEAQLREMILEGGGGGTTEESYGLAFRFAAYHTATDSFEKRGKKGYLITIGDEKPWPMIKKEEVQKIFGVTAQADETVEELIEKAKEKWEIYHILPKNTSHGSNSTVHNRWKELLGERFVLLENEDLMCDTIAGLVFMLESSKSVDAVLDDMKLSGGSRDIVKNALVPVEANRVPAHIASGSVPDTVTKKKTTTRI